MISILPEGSQVDVSHSQVSGSKASDRDASIKPGEVKPSRCDGEASLTAVGTKSMGSCVSVNDDDDAIGSASIGSDGTA